MDITETDWDAYEAQLADNMTNLTDSFSNLDASDKVDKVADLLSQSIMEAFNSATDLTYVSCKVKPLTTPVGYVGCEGSQETCH